VWFAYLDTTCEKYPNVWNHMLEREVFSRTIMWNKENIHCFLEATPACVLVVVRYRLKALCEGQRRWFDTALKLYAKDNMRRSTEGGRRGEEGRQGGSGARQTSHWP